MSFWDRKEPRRHWPALYEAAKQFGDRIYYSQPAYVEPGYCKWCGKKLEGRRTSFCSDECSKAFGKATVWGRGRTPYTLRILHRDNFTCQRCGIFMAYKNKYGVYIPVDDPKYKAAIHHMRPVSLGGSDAPENLVSLCGSCHDEVHRQIRETGAYWKSSAKLDKDN